MKNPWEEIPLADYEAHMQLGSVRQLQALNAIMREQLGAFPAESVMIFGVAGGNGLEYIRTDQFRAVYGVDINAAYLAETARRYPAPAGVLTCLRIDLTRETDALPHAELVIADLLVEYIGCACFQRAVQRVQPRYVSCVIQIDAEDGWVSDSPYLHVFDGLDRVHRPVTPAALACAMAECGYRQAAAAAEPLPNGKQLMRMDFAAAGC